MAATATKPQPLGEPPVMLADVLDGRDNNLNVIRIAAASAVLVSHAWPITLGSTATEPLAMQTGQSLGHFAVAVFFGISGLLIARSFDRRRSMIHFVVARILRLYPALIAVLVITVVAGAGVSRLDLVQYAHSRETWSYLPANLSLAAMQYSLPGVFEGNPYGPPINGSLWTLFYEVACYFGVVVLGLFGILRRQWIMLVVMGLATVTHFVAPMFAKAVPFVPPGLLARIELLALVAFPFMLGTFAYVWRERIRLTVWIAVLMWLPVPMLVGTDMMTTAITLALVYTTFWIGFVPKGPLLAYNRLGDYSYGVYIYAFPVQQLFVSLFPGISPLTNIALAIPATLLLAVLSWNLVEERALAKSTPLADRLLMLVRRPENRPNQSV